MHTCDVRIEQAARTGCLRCLGRVALDVALGACKAACGSANKLLAMGVPQSIAMVHMG